VTTEDVVQNRFCVTAVDVGVYFMIYTSLFVLPQISNIALVERVSIIIMIQSYSQLVNLIISSIEN